MDAFETGAIVALAGLGIGVIIITLLGIAAFIGTIILLCKAIKERGELKVKGIDEVRIKKVVTLAIWTLVISVISCSGCVLIVLPILAIVFANSNARTALNTGDVAEAIKKADAALIMIIVGNSLVIGLSVINTIIAIVSAIIEVL